MFVILVAAIVVLSLAAPGQQNHENMEHGQQLYRTMIPNTSWATDELFLTEKKIHTEKRSGDGGPIYTLL